MGGLASKLAPDGKERRNPRSSRYHYVQLRKRLVAGWRRRRVQKDVR